MGRGSRVYPPGEFDAWTTIVVRNGSDESLTPFTYVVGDPLPGCPRLKATKRDTNLLKPKSIGRPFHPTGFSWQVAPVAPAIMQDELPEGRWADYPVPPEDVGQIAELAKAVLYLGSNFAITIDLRNVSMPFNSMPFNPAIVEALGPIETFWMRVRWHRAVRLGKHPAGGNHPAHGVVPVVFCLSGFLAASTSEKAG